MRYLLLVLILTACARVEPGPAGPQPPLDLMGTLALPAPARPLLFSYRLNSPLQPSYAGMVYRPRTPAGPDTLTLPTNPNRNGYGLSEWLSIDLNRAARITVTPVSAVPAWLSGWTRNGVSYWREFPPGRVALGPPANLEPPYAVSLLEAGGAPSSAPFVPDGQPAPVPNQPCPAWVHDGYAATGPDGLSYPTWHPQIDPRYWCSFGHEHGSRPADGAAPLYGYTASRHGMAEPHAGFKTYTIADGAARWTITQHFGTSGQGRACTQFHTLDVAYSDAGTLLADLHFMGDFGKGEVVSGQTVTPITSCAVNQTTLASTGTRHLHLTDNGGYEPWRAELNRVALGFSSPGLSFDTGDARTACADVTCASLVPRGDNAGADHRVSNNRPLRIQATVDATGVFYTDPAGEQFVPSSQPGATRQYVKPGLNVTGPAGTCFTADPWVGLLHCGGQILDPNKNLENSITNGN